MDKDRFHALAAAHGGDISRWPAAERGIAAALAASSPGEADAVLAAERRLDDALAAYETAQPGLSLRQRIIDAAPAARAAARVWRWVTGVGLGVGLAASAAAGVAAGFTLAPTSVMRLISGPAPSGGDVSALADPAVDAADS